MIKKSPSQFLPTSVKKICSLCSLFALTGTMNLYLSLSINSSFIANNRQNLTKCYSLMQRKFWAR